jgi:putative transposase
MPEYRRSYLPGGTFFFTIVTCQRQPILTSPDARHLLREAWLNVQKRFPFTTVAVVILPDHLHSIWTLPEEDSNYSLRWSEIKRLFSISYQSTIGTIQNKSASQRKRHEAAIWQRRFWEHTIRDEEDLHRHIDYIHFNPVKHGFVQKAIDWEWSSFRKYVEDGFYESDWGQNADFYNTNFKVGE